MKLIWIIILSLTLISGCNDSPWNNPHKTKTKQSTYHSSFSEQPKTLDPAKSYNANESLFTAQIYEPPLQYHFLKRPYELIPLTAEVMPKLIYLNAQGKEVDRKNYEGKIAKTVYVISIKPGIFYQPHPAFARNQQGELIYHQLTERDLRNINTITDFRQSGTRELTAYDYVNQIKRLADPSVSSPIYGLMSKYIIGLKEFNQALSKNANDKSELAISGVKALDKYTYQIEVYGEYPQFLYWLAMPFFSPMPWEAENFYQQAVLRDKNISLDWFPMGTGPYMLVENNPNQEIVLEKNPNYRVEFFPGTNEKLPYIDSFQFSLEKESIPRWAKFLQGYYDASGISSDNFDQAITVNEQGQPELSKEMQEKNLQLDEIVNPAIYYFGFNMLDPIVGGNTERARKLRQAIAIIVNFEEYISIFLNGQGFVAHGPIPPGITGFKQGKEGINLYTHTWKEGKALRKAIAKAKSLLKEAGYANGRNIKTGKPLILYFDTPGGGNADNSAMFAWLRKQFSKLGIQLEIRVTQYNRFQEKMRTGNAQLFMWGWLADYPDPENFLFLFYGPNSKVLKNGENATNYSNADFDVLFEKMKNLPNGVLRDNIIEQMIAILQKDSPIIGGFFPNALQLSHHWLSNVKPNPIANNTLKYIKLNKQAREKYHERWNQPLLWPLALIAVVFLLFLVPVIIKYNHKRHKKTLKNPC